MDRNGEFKRVVVWDKNFCYDSANAVLTSLEKTDVKETHVKQLKTTTPADGVLKASVEVDGILSVTTKNDCTNTVVDTDESPIYCNGAALAN
jgi:hypothetical protein